jgi:hypothetical protein
VDIVKTVKRKITGKLSEGGFVQSRLLHQRNNHSFSNPSPPHHCPETRGLLRDFGVDYCQMFIRPAIVLVPVQYHHIFALARRIFEKPVDGLKACV